MESFFRDRPYNEREHRFGAEKPDRRGQLYETSEEATALVVEENLRMIDKPGGPDTYGALLLYSCRLAADV
jgi:hypothetical protein